MASSFIGGGNRSGRKKITDLSQITANLSNPIAVLFAMK
jgi:hypothetical protein